MTTPHTAPKPPSDYTNQDTSLETQEVNEAQTEAPASDPSEQPEVAEGMNDQEALSDQGSSDKQDASHDSADEFVDPFSYRGYPPPSIPINELPKVYLSFRKLVKASKICSIVSLFIGGIVLSSIALICAILAKKRAKEIFETQALGPNIFAYTNIKKNASKAFLLALVVVIINLIASFYTYNMLTQMMADGSLNGLLSGAASTATNPLWG